MTWIAEEVQLARARLTGIPRSARPVVTSPICSSTTCPPHALAALQALLARLRAGRYNDMDLALAEYIAGQLMGRDEHRTGGREVICCDDE